MTDHKNCDILIVCQKGIRYNMRLISNSEVTSFTKCQRNYYFEYVLDLEPKVASDPVTKGILVHSALEFYYVAKSEGASEGEAREAAQTPLLRAMTDDVLDVPTVGELSTLLTGYFNSYPNDDKDYEVISVEGKFALQLSDDFGLPGTLDLIWRDRSDNRYIVIDHKTSYNFFTEEQLATLGQVPKYIQILRSMGLDVKYAILNQLRTRNLKPGNELYRRSVINPSKSRIAAVIQQHKAISEQIIKFRETATLDSSIPSLNRTACSNCPFFSLCDSSLEGAPLKYTIQQEFKTRTSYGYN